jgi:hypothetical protein
MPLARSLFVAALSAAGVAALAAPALAPARPGATCGSSGYAYAGVTASGRAYGISARLVAVTPPQVASGHVAAWVGVGGVGMGPRGTNEWLQVGFSGFPGSSSLSLYYELARPNAAPHYYELESGLAPGTARKVAVLELRGRPNWWRVVVDGKAVSSPIELAGSHGAWSPTATTESWGGGTFVCNRFWFRFASLSVASASPERWSGLGPASSFSDHGYRVVRQTALSFLAGAR